MKLTPAQSQIVKDNHRFRVVNCGRRFGKTTLSAFEMIGYGMASDNARIPYYAPTRDDARDIMWKMLCGLAQEIIIDKNESRLELTIRNKLGGSSFLNLYGWEAVQERKKGVGVKNSFIVLDEVAKYRNFWLGWNEVLRPTLTDLRGGALFTSTPNGFNHFYDLNNQELTDKDFKTFHFTSYDNPHLPTDELDTAKRTLPPETFLQEYMASFQKTQGLVYKEFNREKHLYDKLPEGIFEKIAGIDFGYANPAAVLHIYTNSEKYYIDDEWYKRGRTETQIAEYVAGCKFQSVYPDPESPSAIEELRRRGVNIREVSKGKDSIASGIQKIRELLLQGKLFINKRCVNLLYEFETYSYDEEDKDRDAKEKPIKENNHALDALRYAVFMTWNVGSTMEELREIDLTRRERIDSRKDTGL